MFIGKFNRTVIVTYLSIVAFLVGAYYSIFEGNIVAGIICLVVSGICDAFDGKIARMVKNRTDEDKAFGIQIDSLSDIIAFGVLPAAIGYSVGLTEWWGKLIMAIFVLAALIRLAYFNVMEEQRQKKTDEVRKEYLGLPVTTDALIFPLVYALKGFFHAKFYIFYAIMLVLIAFLFLYKFKVKKPNLKGMIIMTAVGIIELLLLIWLMK